MLCDVFNGLRFACTHKNQTAPWKSDVNRKKFEFFYDADEETNRRENYNAMTQSANYGFLPEYTIIYHSRRSIVQVHRESQEKGLLQRHEETTRHHHFVGCIRRWQGRDGHHGGLHRR